MASSRRLPLFFGGFLSPRFLPTLLLALLSGCSNKTSEGGDTSDANASGTDEGYCTGEGKTVRVNGRDIREVGDPRVGDQWMALLYCEGSLVIGASTLRFSPPDVATIDSMTSEITFVAEGDAEMILQVGNKRYEHELTVLPAL